VFDPASKVKLVSLCLKSKTWKFVLKRNIGVENVSSLTAIAVLFSHLIKVFRLSVNRHAKKPLKLVSHSAQRLGFDNIG